MHTFCSTFLTSIFNIYCYVLKFINFPGIDYVNKCSYFIYSFVFVAVYIFFAPFFYIKVLIKLVKAVIMSNLISFFYISFYVIFFYCDVYSIHAQYFKHQFFFILYSLHYLQLFDRVKQEQSPDIVHKKTHLIAGDMMQENMGM